MEKENIRVQGTPVFAALMGMILTIVAIGVIQSGAYAANTMDNTDIPFNGTENTDLPDNSTITAPTNNTSSTNQATSLRHSEGIKVYGENNAELTGINWGAIVLGKTSFYYISVANVGDQPVTLELSVTNWTPGVDGVVSWNYNGKAVPVGDKVSITLSLTIKESSVSTFGNDIIISSKSI